MGLTYHSKKGDKRCEAFDVNSWGADLLGWLHEQLKLPVSEDDPAWKHFGRGEPFRVPYTAKADDCREWAFSIARRSDEEIRQVLRDRKGRGWGDTEDGWVCWVRKWQSFLQNCSGYRCI